MVHHFSTPFHRLPGRLAGAADMIASVRNRIAPLNA
jgi:hypothetical protein